MLVSEPGIKERLKKIHGRNKERWGGGKRQDAEVDFSKLRDRKIPAKGR